LRLLDEWSLGAATGSTKIVVDAPHGLPAEFACSIGQCVLPPLAFAAVVNLTERQYRSPRHVSAGSRDPIP